MKAKLFATILLLCALCGAASGQNYDIRLTSNTNLRAEASLQSRIVETASAGTTLPVMGSAGRWLQINWNGQQVWMADWVSYTRLNSAAGAASQPANAGQQAQVDNCCFVDRQCHTDQDWTDGYWAFQNGQCAAPAQPAGQPSQPSQPAPAVSPQVDNCCFVDRQCHTDQEWTNGYLAYQNNQCGANQLIKAVSGLDVAIEGSPYFISQVRQAFDFMKERAPYWYSYAANGLNRIVQSDSIRGLYPISRTYSMVHDGHPPDGHTMEQLYAYMGGTFAHEACHAYLFAAGQRFAENWQEEKICTGIQVEALRAAAPNHPWISYLEGLIANIEDPATWWWS
ncbi:MAG: SH3 domain-containing protein [Chloroflexota bacterium]|nr:SH3 domain-containing protein [Chloroflexota bacterium]